MLQRRTAEPRLCRRARASHRSSGFTPGYFVITSSARRSTSGSGRSASGRPRMRAPAGWSPSQHGGRR
eukprot:11284082-Alexandrium_andersonii.AAC.1